MIPGVLSLLLGTYFITCNISSHTTMLISSFSKKKDAHLILCCRAHIALQTHLPEALRDGTFDNGLRVSLVLDSSAVSNQPLPHLN